MVHSRILQRILMPLSVIDQSVPKLALAPIFVIWFGTGMMTRVVIAMVISFFPMVINAIRGMTTADRRVNDLMTTISASRVGHSDQGAAAERRALHLLRAEGRRAISIIGAVVAEFMQSDSGLGYVVLFAVGNVGHADGFRRGPADGAIEPRACSRHVSIGRMDADARAVQLSDYRNRKLEANEKRRRAMSRMLATIVSGAHVGNTAQSRWSRRVTAGRGRGFRSVCPTRRLRRISRSMSQKRRAITTHAGLDVNILPGAAPTLLR